MPLLTSNLPSQLKANLSPLITRLSKNHCLFLLLSFLFISVFIHAQDNRSLHFDGSNDHIDFASGPDLNNTPFTFEFWAKRQPSSGTGYIIQVDGIDARLTSSSVVFRLPSNGSLAIQNPATDDGQWHHYALVYDPNLGSNHRSVYIDGLFVGENDAEDPITGENLNLTIGRRSNGFSPYKGGLDELRIWNTARTSSEISNNLYCEIDSNTIGLLAYFDFNEGNVNGNNSGLDHLENRGIDIYNGTLNNFSLMGNESNWSLEPFPYSKTTITRDPENQISVNGSPVLFTAQASNSCNDTLLYQWYFDNELIPGETATSFIINTPNQSDHGTYHCVVSGGGRSVASAGAVLITEILSVDTVLSDAYIDVSWEIPYLPCLQDNASNPYLSYTTQLLENGVEVDFVTYDGSILQDINNDIYPNISSAFSFAVEQDSNLFLDFCANVDSQYIQDVVDYTLEFWVKTSNFHDYHLIHNGSGFSRSIKLDNQRIKIGSRTSSILPLRNDDWNHIAIVTLDNINDTDIYINGNHADRLKIKYDLDEFTMLGNGEASFDFILGEFRIWDEAKSAQEISDNMVKIRDTDHLLSQFKHNAAEDQLIDFASAYDGIKNCLNSNGSYKMVDPDPALNIAISGNYRSFQGPSANASYDLALYKGTFGQSADLCNGYQVAGSTLPVQAPDQFIVSDSLLDEIYLTWTNNSDLATSYKIYRDGLLIETITDNIIKGSTHEFRDPFDIFNNTGIQSGQSYTYTLKMESSLINQTWDYPLGQGQTVDLNFTATDAPIYDNKVELNWLPLNEDLFDEYQIWRNQSLYRVILKNEVKNTDFNPYYGDSTSYQLRVLENDTVRAAYEDFGSTPASGHLSGRVITDEGLFPTSGVTVTLERVSNDSSYTFITDELGFYTFEDLPFGLMDSFDLSATLIGHEFTYPIDRFGLNINTPSIENTVILDNFEYSTGNNSPTIQSFIAQTDATADKVDLSWSGNVGSGQILIDLIANGNVLFTSNDTSGLNTNFTDLEGIPGEEVNYSLRFYQITGNEVAAVTLDTTVIFPKVSKIPIPNFTAYEEQGQARETGNVQLDWTHTSSNVDAFRIYRNDSLIVELPIDSTSYLDNTAPFQTDLTYQITAIRLKGAVTFETENPTISIPDTINLGNFAAPENVIVSQFTSTGRNRISWNAPLQIDAEYDFDGYYVYRNQELINIIQKDRNLAFSDKRGFGLTNIIYAVSTFKTSDSGHVIESIKTPATPIDFPEYGFVPDLNQTTNVSEGYTDLSWNALGYNNNNLRLNYHGFILEHNGVRIAKLPSFISTFRHYGSRSSTNNYSLKVYKEDYGQLIISPVASTESVLPYGGSGNLLSPQNVMVTRDIPNHSKICWEYLDFVPSEFVIYRDGVSLDTLPPFARSYYDYSGDLNNHALDYQVKAIQLGMESLHEGATGDISKPKLVYGQLLDSIDQRGIPYAEIIIEWNNIQNIRAFTDSSGFFQIRIPNEIVNGNLVIIATPGNDFKAISDTLYNDTMDSYHINLFYNDPLPYIDEAFSNVIFADLYTDTFNLNGILHWQTSGNAYTGVQIMRGINEVALLDKASGSLWLDEAASPGIKYTYQIRTFTDGDRGRTFGKFYIFEYTYPRLFPVENLQATAYPSRNYVDIQWSHRYDHADGYLILRNDEFFDELKKNNPFRIIDSSGVANQNFVYTVIPYLLSNGALIYGEERSIEVVFPRVGKIENLYIAATFETSGGDTLYQNHNLITWKYKGSNLISFKIFRDGTPLQTLPPNQFSFADFEASTNTIIEYGVAAIVEQGGILVESELVTSTFTSKKLQAPINVGVTANQTQALINVDWTYNWQGVDGFRVYRNTTNNFNSSHLIETVLINEDLNDFTYNFQDPDPAPESTVWYAVSAISTREGNLNESIKVDSSAIMPNTNSPTTVSATDGIYDNAVSITWDFPIEANADGFLILKEDTSSMELDSIYINSPFDRSYLDNMDINEEGAVYNYEIRTCRLINGVYYCNSLNPNSDTGYPKKIDKINQEFSSNAQNEMGHSVSVDKDWMVVGLPSVDSVYIYQFVNQEWILKQNIAGDESGSRFGHAVAINDDRFVVGAPERNLKEGGVYIYELSGNTWMLDTLLRDDQHNFRLGFSVDIEGNTIVAGRPDIGYSDPLISSSFENPIRVWKNLLGSSTWTQLNNLSGTPNQSSVTYAFSGQVYENAFTPQSFGFTVAIDGNSIIVGDPHADLERRRVFPTVTPWAVVKTDVGFAVEYLIDNLDVQANHMFFDVANILKFAGFQSWRFGYDVDIEDDFAAISSRKGQPNGITGEGKVTIHTRDGSSWDAIQELESNDPAVDHNFGYSLAQKDDLLLISEPSSFTTNIRLDSKLFLFQLNTTSNLYEIIQSPDTNNTLFRKDFFDSGSPDKYPIAFGYDVDLSDGHIAVGAPARKRLTSKNGDPGTTLFDGKAYPLLIFTPKITNLIASDGNLDDTRLTWQVECDGCPSDYIDSFYIFRDTILIARIESGSNLFFDEASVLINGAPEAIIGKPYLYEIQGKANLEYDLFSQSAADIGFSKRQGSLEGTVTVQGTSIGVEGVTIIANGLDLNNNFFISDTTISLSDGSFVLDQLYIPTQGIIYELSSNFGDHVLTYPNGNSFVLTPTASSKTAITIVDETAYAVAGNIDIRSTSCSHNEIMVKYYSTINGNQTLRDSVRTTDGQYSLLIDPNEVGLESIEIIADNLQSIPIDDINLDLQYLFTSTNNVFTQFTGFPVESEVNFLDTLNYLVDIYVENPCHNPVADQAIEVRIASYDGCYDAEILTDFNGFARVKLPPNDYFIVVTGIVGSGVTNYENAAIDFLKLRPSQLSLLSIHANAGHGSLPSIDPVYLTYHRAIGFTETTSFERYLCDDPTQAPIVSQGEKHSINFSLNQNHRPGEICSVENGSLVIRNSASTAPTPFTIQSENGSFPLYNFTAGTPNLVSPHVHSISVQYFAENGNLLGSDILPIIVEGQRQLPGTGFESQANNDASGDVLMPLFVLRDPPGDNSYSQIESNTSVNKSLIIEDTESSSYGFYTDVELFAGSSGGFFLDFNLSEGDKTSNSASYDFSINTTQAYSTSNLETGIGRDANVIVGAGMGTQYGLTQSLSFDNNCEPKFQTIVSYGISGFNSTFAYTVEFIENLIEKYQNDSLLIANGFLTLVDQNGEEYTTEVAIEKVVALKESWKDMMHYHDVETVPHYVLCNDLSYRDDDLPNDVVSVYNNWQKGFCNLIGSYDDNENFIMDQSIDWTPSLINAYNNTVAFTDTLKTFKEGTLNNNLRLSNNEITNNGLAVTQQFHNSLGNNLKSAEVFDLSGGVQFERTASAQQSSSIDYSFTRFSELSLAAGLFAETEIAAGLGVTVVIASASAKVGGTVKQDASISVSNSMARSNSTEVYYNIFDDDVEDQLAFLVLQAPLQDQTPFFIRLGGLSSCPPEEALTINQDNAPLLIDDPDFTVVIDPISGASTPNPPPAHNVPIGQAATFEVQLGNLGPTIQPREATVFLDLLSNPFGAIVKLGGSDLNIVSPSFIIPQGGSITQFLTVERPSSTSFYDFENLRIGLKPTCGGETKWITLDVYFQSPCSPVSLTQPSDDYIVNRINPFIIDDREVVPFEIRDYESANQNLVHVQLQYLREGTGQGWQNVPNGLIQRSTLAISDANLAIGQDPLYFYEWDITGQYNQYPNGSYRLRALAFCGINGIQYSNENTIILDRSNAIAVGYPEPSDQIWTQGDQISITYNLDLDCGVLNVTDSIQDYISLVDLNTLTPVPFTLNCANNKIILESDSLMSLYDGHILRATYQNISSMTGNPAEKVVWDFKVITQDVDWLASALELSLYEGEIVNQSTSILNSLGQVVNNLSLSALPSWLTLNEVEPFSVASDGRSLEFEFDASALSAGDYMSTISIQGMSGRSPLLNIILHVLENPPVPPIDSNLQDSMKLVLNWSFSDPYSLSNDLLDQIQVYMDGTYRGSGFIEAFGNFHTAVIQVYGDSSETNKDLEFIVWNADQSQAYLPIASTNISFNPGTTLGVINNPEVIIVDNDVFEFRKRIYVDSSNVDGLHDGMSWETSFNSLQDAIASANYQDTIWMSQGVYYPTLDNDRAKSFEINEGITLYGGFSGSENHMNQRPVGGRSILSGNIGFSLDSTDNSYHVVKANAAEIMFDHITIRDGYADGQNLDALGGNILNSAGLNLVNCLVEDGYASMGGQLIYNTGILSINGGVFKLNDLPISSLFNVGGYVTIDQNVQFSK